jgi:hypothetical protein
MKLKKDPPSQRTGNQLEMGTPTSPPPPPKESLLEDAAELILSLYPPTALIGMGLSFDDAKGAVMDMIDNPGEIGLNRRTLENALDLAAMIPPFKSASKAIDLGKGAFQLAKKKKDFTHLLNMLQVAGYASDRLQEEGVERAAYSPRSADELPPDPAPASMKAIPPRVIPYKSIPYSLVKPALPEVDLSFRPYVAQRDRTRVNLPTLER